MESPYIHCNKNLSLIWISPQPHPLALILRFQGPGRGSTRMGILELLFLPSDTGNRIPDREDEFHINSYHINPPIEAFDFLLKIYISYQKFQKINLR
jgi:hypothetical protein